MLDTLFTNPFVFFGWLISLVIAITIHEFAHAYAADRLGDPTPRVQGRLTLNPLAHLDPLGTLLLILVRFGWGKPVQFDPYNLENPRRDSAIISFAGPLSNLILATIASILIRFIFPTSEILFAILMPFVYLNILLAIFNLIPVHPLDGGKILVGLLPDNKADEVDHLLKQYGTFLLLILILPIFSGHSLATMLITPTVNFIFNLLLPNLGII
jgi:Zn-dependent protease